MSCSHHRSPIEADEKEVIKLAKKLKKEKVSAASTSLDCEC